MRASSFAIGLLLILVGFHPIGSAQVTNPKSSFPAFPTGKPANESGEPTGTTTNHPESSINQGNEPTGIQRIPGGEKIQSFAWLGASDFLVFRDGQRVDAVRTNGQNGQETPLPGLSKLLKENLGKPDGVNIITGVSADGQWCLWWPLSNPKFLAAKLDGTRQCSWERPTTFVSPRWLNEGHRWFLSQESKVLFATTEGSSPQILLYDPETPMNVRKIPIGGQPDPAAKPIGLGKYGEFNQIGSSNGKPRTARGYHYELTESWAKRKDQEVVVPTQMAKLGTADIPRPSPDGTNLLWKIDAADGKSASFHLTRPDGSEPVPLAEFSLPDKSKIEFGLFDPKWSGDGKKFAFLANGVIFWVAVNR